VLGNLLEKKQALVQKMFSNRLGTTCPTDLFSLMSEHLKIAKQGGSLTLQRKLLSLLMAEIARYAGQVLLAVMEEWHATPDALDLDYVTACINDAGTMLDLLEQLEADFAPALAQLTETSGNDIARMENRIGGGISMGFTAAAAAAAGAGGDGSGTPLMDDFDREEEEHAREDLAAIAQDIPRSRGELLKCGTQLTGILLDVIMEVRGELGQG